MTGQGQMSSVVCVLLMALVAEPFSSAPALAQCSTITGPGMPSSGACPPQRHFNYPAPSGGGSVAHFNSGRANYGTAIGAAGVMLGVLGDAIESEQTDENARDQASRSRELAARRAYCVSNWQQASSEIATGNDFFNHWDPGGAIGHYERAIALLRPCNDVRNIAVARHNLDNAQRQFAAVKDDDRVDDLRSRYANVDAYNAAANPFAGSTIDANSATAFGALKPADEIADAAAKRCDYAPVRSTAWTNCMLTQEARLIDDADADIKSTCEIESTVVAKNQCAIRVYAEKLQRQASPSNDNTNCYFDKRGGPCISGDRLKALQEADKGMSLRDRLKRNLEAARAKSAAGRTTVDEEGDATHPAKSSGSTEAAQPSSSVSGVDDPLRDYLKAQNFSTGTRNDGDLGRPAFTMSGSETRKEIDRLTRPIDAPAPGRSGQ